MLWQKTAKRTGGGYWFCRIKDRERKAQARRRRGVPVFGSPEHRSACSEAKQGWVHPSNSRTRLGGPSNGRWVGDAADYDAAHLAEPSDYSAVDRVPSPTSHAVKGRRYTPR